MHHERSFGDAMVRGAIAGFVGAVAMFPLMFTMKRLGLTREVFPKQVEEELTRRAGLPELARGRVSDILAYTAHLAYGALLGGFFGGLRYVVSAPTFPFAQLFGLATYAVGFLGWVPALGILPPIWRQREPIGVMRIMAHIYYGTVVSLAFDRMRGLTGRMVERAEERTRETAEQARRRVA
jgi:hypothetical protein